MIRFSGHGRSEVGHVRSSNEDSGFVGPSCLLVADGVGGAAAGEVASATATYVVGACALAEPGAEPAAVLRSALGLAQEQLRLGVRRVPERAGMATTLTALLTDGERVALAHVGDSRCYVLRGDGELTRVTRDHTFVQQLVDDGSLSEAERARHPWRHMVVRSLDGDPDERADVTRLDLGVGDRVLLASDGLTDLVSERRIEAVLRRRDDDDAVDSLVEAALVAGGRDNVTCVVATLVSGGPVVGDGVLLGAARDPRVVVDPAAVRMRTA